MSLQRGPKIVTEGLIFYVDAANPKSYISGSTNVENLLPLNNNITGSLKNGVKYGVWIESSIEKDFYSEEKYYKYRKGLKNGKRF